MAKMPLTIRDIAQRAGVGAGTVSRVLNDSPLVSEATRRKVLAVIEELDYRPNSVARKFSLGRTLAIGVVIFSFTRPIAVERLRGLSAAVARSGYDLIVFNVETPKQRDEYFRNLRRREQVDGLIIVSLPPDDDQAAYFRRAEIPVVLADCRHRDLSYVAIDDIAGGRVATQHLIDLGHRRIAFVGDLPSQAFRFTSSYERYEGYSQAIGKAGIHICTEYYRQGVHSRHQAHHMVEELLRLSDAPTAIFAASDIQAIGVLDAVRAAGLHVPDDISVIGFDDIEAAEYIGLTTLHQPQYQLGIRTVEILVEALHNANQEPVSETFPAELVVRNTTAPPGAGAEKQHQRQHNKACWNDMERR